MTSRDRVLTALDHREPDRVPRDLGATRVSGVHVAAYGRLRAALGLPERDSIVIDFSQRLARVDDDVVELLGLDVGGVEPAPASTYRRTVVD
jgi:uroporphyrinogen decarboxylase